MRPPDRSVRSLLLAFALLVPALASAHDAPFEHPHPHAEGHVPWPAVGIAALVLVALGDTIVRLRRPRA